MGTILGGVGIGLAKKESPSRPDIIITPSRLMLPSWPFTLNTSWRSPPGSRLLYPCSIPGDMAVEESDDEFWRFVDEVSGG